MAGESELMRLIDAQFKNSSKAFRVTTDGENWEEDYSRFDLEPLSGATLAKECLTNTMNRRLNTQVNAIPAKERS